MYRDEPRTPGQILAAIEERLRRTESAVSGASIAGGVPTDLFEDAGDLLVGLASGSPGRLGRGTEGQVLTSTADTVEWRDPDSDSAMALIFLGGM